MQFNNSQENSEGFLPGVLISIIILSLHKLDIKMNDKAERTKHNSPNLLYVLIYIRLRNK